MHRCFLYTHRCRREAEMARKRRKVRKKTRTRRASSKTSAKGSRTIIVQLPKSELALYGSARLVNAIKQLTADMNLYEGVRFGQILEAVYTQGKKDGARTAFEEVEQGVIAARRAIPHKNPGRPRK